MSERASAAKENVEIEKKKRAIKAAERLVRGVTVTRSEREGRVTATRLRRMLALASEAEFYDEFKLRLLYLTERNTSQREKELENFVSALLKHLKGLEEDKRLEEARLVLEYAVMQYAAKELGIR